MNQKDFDALIERLYARVVPSTTDFPITPQSRNFFAGKTVCITGAGGSIGTALCQSLHSLKPANLICIDQAEISLFNLKKNLDAFSFPIHFYLGDVARPEVLRRIFAHHKIDVFVHAAAYKHVTIAEQDPAVVILNNLDSTLNCLNFAKEHHVPHFTFISTDKAVKPNSVMGKSKALCERMVAAARQSGHEHYRSFRCGNVLGSSGSVVHEFIRQLEARNEIMVTDPHVNRYFVRPKDIATHILNATASQDSYDAAIAEMGTPIRIVDLGDALIKELAPAQPATIVFSQLQEGEKLNEELKDPAHETPCGHKDHLTLLSFQTAYNQGTIDQLTSFMAAVIEKDAFDAKAMLDQTLAQTKTLLPVLPTRVSSETANRAAWALRSRQLGPTSDAVKQFEQALCQLTNSPHVVATASGSAALHIASLLAAETGAKSFLSSTFSYAASLFPSINAGLKPVLLDVDASDWHLDLNLLETELKKGSRTAPNVVVLPHIYGGAANAQAARDLCAKHHAILIEDAAEALGVTWKSRHVGTFGDFGILSFNANKLITTAGGGALLLNDKGMAEKARRLISQGKVEAPYYRHELIGFNYALSGVQASIGLCELNHLKSYIDSRRSHHKALDRELANQDPDILSMPYLPNCSPNYWTSAFQLPVSDMEAVRQALHASGIDTRRLWMPLHLQPALQGVSYRGGHVAEDLFASGLILPSDKQLTAKQISAIVEAVIKAVAPQKQTSFLSA